MTEVCEECDVEPQQIQTWIRQERLPFSDDSPIKVACESCGKMIGRRRALVRLAQTVGESIVSPETQTLYVAHCDCKEDAERVAELIRAKVPSLKNIEIAMYDFCTGAHVGPGAIAVFYFGTPRP